MNCDLFLSLFCNILKKSDNCSILSTKIHVGFFTLKKKKKEFLHLLHQKLFSFFIKKKFMYSFIHESIQNFHKKNLLYYTFSIIKSNFLPISSSIMLPFSLG